MSLSDKSTVAGVFEKFYSDNVPVCLFNHQYKYHLLYQGEKKTNRPLQWQEHNVHQREFEVRVRKGTK